MQILNKTWLRIAFIIRQHDFLEHLDSLAEADTQSILCDFEKGLHNALHSIFPSTTVRGCYFHFKQALLRKMQAFDLVPEYKVLSSPVMTSGLT